MSECERRGLITTIMLLFYHENSFLIIWKQTFGVKIITTMEKIKIRLEKSPKAPYLILKGTEEI